MFIYFLFYQAINPFLSVNILAPDDYTDDYFGAVYQFEIENDFYRKNFTWGIYFDYFYNKAYPYADPYFIKSGIPVGINAGGSGLQVKYLNLGDIEFGFKLGYFTGNVSYPVLKDSGKVIKGEKRRNSLGFGLGVNIMHNFGIIRGGVKFWANFIDFDAKSPKYYWYYGHSPDYISLNGVGLGLILGLKRRQGK